MHQTFEAQAFHPDFGNEVVNGQIFFTGATLRFRSGETSIEIPLERLVADVESADAERITLSDPEQPELKIFTSDPSLLACRSLPPVEQIRQQLSRRLTRREVARRLKIVGYFLGACVLVAWVFTAATSAMVRAVAARVPQEWEAEMGDGLMAELKTKVDFLEDTNQVARLTALAEPLMQVLPEGRRKFTFHIVQDVTPNAQALPGGHILVHTGLLDMSDSPEELLGVIAHEMAHVTQKHHFRKEIASGGPFLIFRTFVGGRSGTMGILAGISALMVGQGFSQEYETEADNVGWEFLVKANIDPRGMAWMFRKLNAYEMHQRVMKLPQAFSSHPALEKRIARLEAKWQHLPRKSGFLQLSPNQKPMQ